jgi:HEAT repeat protein/GGDEF domain-containing protein
MPEPETGSLNVLILCAVPPEQLVTNLRAGGFNVISADEAKKVLEHQPDVVLLSSENDASFPDDLKNILRIHPAPLIYLGIPAPEIKSEIDDYCPPPLDCEYLAFKIRSLSQRIQCERDINPLTGLPGNRLINNFLTRACSSSDRTVVYVDINDFKPYNDTYGFGKGDEVIKALGSILSEAVSRRSADSFVGHIGGDDFIVICPDGETEELSKEVMDGFEISRNRFYTGKDLARGLIVAMDRDGRRRNFPLLSLSIVSFRVSQEFFKNAAEISRRAMYLKKRLKAKSSPQGNSIYLRDGDEHGMADARILEELASSSCLPLPVRRSLIEALGETGEHLYFTLLKGLLDDSRSEMIRKSALYALGRLKDPASVPVLIDFLSDPNPHLRTRAVEALGEIGKNEAYEPIRKMVSDENRFVRQKVMESLGKLANRDSLPVLEESLEDSDEKVTEYALGALGELRDPAAVPWLKKYLTVANPQLRSTAVAALGKILHPESAQALFDSLDDKDPYVQWQALTRMPAFIGKGLLEEKRETVLKRLLSAADSGNDAIRRAGIIAMGPLKDRRALNTLDNALADKNALIRWSAALSLGMIADKGSVPSLLQRLNDNNDVVRSAVSWALGETGDQRAVEPLRRALKDRSSRVRESAASAIIRIVLKSRPIN